MGKSGGSWREWRRAVTRFASMPECMLSSVLCRRRRRLLLLFIVEIITAYIAGASTRPQTAAPITAPRVVIIVHSRRADIALASTHALAAIRRRACAIGATDTVSPRARPACVAPRHFSYGRSKRRWRRRTCCAARRRARRRHATDRLLLSVCVRNVRNERGALTRRSHRPVGPGRKPCRNMR